MLPDSFPQDLCKWERVPLVGVEYSFKKLVHEIDSLELTLLNYPFSEVKEINICAWFLYFICSLLKLLTFSIFIENNPIEGLICHNGLLILEFRY